MCPTVTVSLLGHDKTGMKWQKSASKDVHQKQAQEVTVEMWHAVINCSTQELQWPERLVTWYTTVYHRAFKVSECHTNIWYVAYIPATFQAQSNKRGLQSIETQRRQLLNLQKKDTDTQNSVIADTVCLWRFTVNFRMRIVLFFPLYQFHLWHIKPLTSDYLAAFEKVNSQVNELFV